MTSFDHYSQRDLNTLLAKDVSPAFVLTANAARRMNLYLLRLLRLLGRTTMVVHRYVVHGPLGWQELSEVKFDGLVRILMSIMSRKMVQYTVNDAGRFLDTWNAGDPRSNAGLVLSLNPSRVLIGNNKRLAVVITAIIEYIALEMMDAASTVAMNKYGTGKITHDILDESVSMESDLHFLFYNLGLFKKKKSGRISRKRVVRHRPDTEDYLLIDALLKRPGPPQALLTQAIEREQERVRRAEEKELLKLQRRGRAQQRRPNAKLPVRGLSPLLAAIKQERRRVKKAQEQQVEEVRGTPRRNRRITRKGPKKQPAAGADEEVIFPQAKRKAAVDKLIDEILSTASKSKGKNKSKSPSKSKSKGASKSNGKNKAGVNPLLVRASKPAPGIGPKCENVYCVHSKVCNPNTGRCVDKKGAVGKKIMKMYQQ